MLLNKKFLIYFQNMNITENKIKFVESNMIN